MSNPDSRPGLLHRLWNWFWRPWVGIAGGSVILAGFVAGVVFWGGFNWSMEITNTETFCISCHEMEENVFKEYRNTVHYTNRTGVRATCPDFPGAAQGPSAKARMHGRPLPELRRKIAPGRAAPSHPQYRIHEQPVVLAVPPPIRVLARNKVLDPRPLRVA